MLPYDIEKQFLEKLKKYNFCSQSPFFYFPDQVDEKYKITKFKRNKCVNHSVSELQLQMPVW